MDEQLEKRNKLAADVLRLSRNTLVVNLRFLDAALSRHRHLRLRRRRHGTALRAENVECSQNHGELLSFSCPDFVAFTMLLFDDCPMR